MNKIDSLIDNKIYQNIFVWVIMYFIFVTSVQGGNSFLFALYINLFFAPPIYINNLLILPLFNKKKILFAILFSINILVVSIALSFLMAYIGDDDFKVKALVNSIGIITLAVLFGIALKI